jgi:hypothetical protein
MTSVPSHLPPLNGSKVLAFLIFLGSVVSSCTPAKVVKSPQVIKADTGTKPKDTGKAPTASDTKPAEKSQPAIPQGNEKNMPSSADMIVRVPVDTVSWTDVSQNKKPITIKQKPKVVFNDGLERKEIYHVTMLIPFDSDGGSKPSESRFVHFYAGALLALEALDAEGYKLDVNVIDTEEGSFKVTEKLDKILGDSTDLVIGPFDREALKFLAEECKLRKIPLISPWQTSTKITVENPYYIQMKPNLKDHFLKLAQTTSASYQKGEVVIIGKDNKDTQAWIKYFQEAAKESIGEKDFFTTYFVSTDSLSLGPTAFRRMLRNPKIKAVIVPNYSYNDEDFIYSCLRRLSAEKAGRSISVYGMPVMYDSEKIDFDYYQSLQMKVVMSDFVDLDHGKIREFRRDFLDMFGEIPTSEAVKGYDLLLYIGRNLNNYGKNFQYYLENDPASYLQSIYEIKKAKSEDSPVANDPLKFDYFENKHLDIIEFRGNKWERKR